MKTQYSFLKRFCFIVGSMSLGAVGFGQVPQSAPLNPEFVKYLQSGLKAGIPNYGLLPSPVDMSHLGAQPIPPELLPPQAFAATYDLRALGKVTSVKNQGQYGTCWAFATFGSMESCLLPSENRDFSENNLVNVDGFDNPFSQGGNFDMSTACLARWGGPVNEISDPYPNPDHSPTGLSVQKHLQQTRIISGKSSPTANDLIKQSLMDYGAVFASYFHDDAYFNLTYNTYRYTGANAGNHAVTLVGWNDNFDKNKFSSVPAGNGAYIVKNSWGTGWGEGGYYYVSYYDSKLGYEPMCSFHGVEASSNYSAAYSYDPFGWVSSVGSGTTTTFWGSNIFTATTGDYLGAVGFYANSPNTSYTIYAYIGGAAGAPRSGTLVATKTGTSLYPGYRTISLDAPAALSAGQRFSLVISLTTPGYNYPLPYEYAIPGYSSAAIAAAGQSYYSADGNTWTDLTSWEPTANFCIKGYTVLSGGNKPNMTPSKPASWSDKIVISTVPGTNTDATRILPTDTLYMDFAVLNDGTAVTSTRYYIAIYVDDQLRTTYYADPPHDPSSYMVGTDYILGTLAVGSHTIRIKADSTDVIAESNETDNEYTKTITLTTSPEIDVEQPLGTNLSDGVSTVACGAAAIGSSSSAKVFTIKNTGNADLTGIAVTADGINVADCVVNTTGMNTALAPACSTTFSVTFKPAGMVSGTRSAAVHIASNDADESPFDIALTGQALSTTADRDGDGLNDWAEYLYAPMGFDWQASQPSLVAELYAGANFAGLFTPSQVQALHIGTPLLARDPATGHFMLTIGIKKSTDLMQWSDFPFTNPGTTLNAEGKIKFDFTVPDSAAFFRLESK